MAPFRFRLSSVLRFRERKREDRRLEMRALEQAKDNVISQIDDLERSLEQYRREMEGQEGRLLSIAELKLAADFSHAVAARIRERRGVLAVIEKKAAAKREELLEANRDVKSLEQLREKRFERHRVEEARTEQKLIDEVGQRKYATGEKGKKFPH
jgi:flagellar FliJ protein